MTLLMCVPIPRWIPEHLPLREPLLLAFGFAEQHPSACGAAARLPDANEDAQVPAGPSRIYMCTHASVSALVAPVDPHWDKGVILE